MVVGPDGTLYFVDEANSMVRKLSPGGGLSVVAGTGVAGYNGDARQATTAQISHPTDIDIGPDGALRKWRWSRIDLSVFAAQVQPKRVLNRIAGWI